MTDDSDSITRIIRQALEDARNRGVDSLGQMHEAVTKIREAQPYLSAQEALKMVMRVMVK